MQHLLVRVQHDRWLPLRKPTDSRQAKLWSHHWRNALRLHALGPLHQRQDLASFLNEPDIDRSLETLRKAEGVPSLILEQIMAGGIPAGERIARWTNDAAVQACGLCGELDTPTHRWWLCPLWAPLRRQCPIYDHSWPVCFKEAGLVTADVQLSSTAIQRAHAMMIAIHQAWKVATRNLEADFDGSGDEDTPDDDDDRSHSSGLKRKTKRLRFCSGGNQLGDVGGAGGAGGRACDGGGAVCGGSSGGGGDGIHSSEPGSDSKRRRLTGKQPLQSQHTQATLETDLLRPSGHISSGGVGVCLGRDGRWHCSICHQSGARSQKSRFFAKHRDCQNGAAKAGLKHKRLSATALPSHIVLKRRCVDENGKSEPSYLTVLWCSKCQGQGLDSGRARFVMRHADCSGRSRGRGQTRLTVH